MTLATDVVARALGGKLRRYSAIVICDGNSLTSASYPSQLAASITDCLVVNVGIGAQNTPGMIAASSDVDAYLAAIAPPRVVIAWELRNDIHTLSATPVEAVDHMEAYCLARRALGAKVVVLNTIQDNYVTSNFSDVEQVAVNAELLNRWPDFADAHVDLWANTNLQDPDNLTYFDADKIHLTSTGYGEVAATVLAALASRSVRALL